MLKLWTKEALPEDMPLLGLLEPPESAEHRVCLRQRIIVRGAGSFIKEHSVAMLDDAGLRDYLAQDGESPVEEQCAGVLMPLEAPDAVGQVRYSTGCYEHCLPVYAPATVSDRWAVRGYLPLREGGYVTVAGRRRLAARIIVALLLAAGAAAGYFIYTYGWDTVCQTVSAWFLSLGLTA